MIRYASVCSGVEAASLAWRPLGWKPVWFSEIEPFPCAVLKERYPDVPNLGDMTKIKGEDYRGVVDLLVGGTPCQGFSTAGKQGGLNDERSVLCLSFINLVRTMRPRWFVWENVPGVFSTNGGEDFKAFLRAIDEIGYSCAFRVLDAQYCRVDGYPRAVPQRRRRVFVIGHSSGDWRYPASVFFESDRLQRDSPPQRVKGKGFTSVAERSIGTTGVDGYSGVVRMRAGKPGGGKSALVSEELSLTLGTGNDQTLICLNDQGGSVMTIEYGGNAGTLRANTHGNEQIVCYKDHARSVVRRLTPVECERLMGFPDNWTRIPWKGKPAEECPDSPRYKACGNSMCVNVMRWIGMRIELVWGYKK